MVERLDAEHGIVCRLSAERMGYFGRRSAARLYDRALCEEELQMLVGQQ